MAQEFPFQAPFVIKDGIIRDQNGKEVRLWGVNYYAPFNHNYINIQQSGISHTVCMDKDFADFKQMNIDLVRIHLYERELTDPRGNLVENDHLKMFDYLVEKAYHEGVFLMLSPSNYWNTVETEAKMHERYAYWDLTQYRTFGFTNFFSVDAMLWHPEAIECQRNYMEQLFRHKNAYSGKRLCDYSNIVVMELINEPIYITRKILEREEPPMGSDIWNQTGKKYLRPMFKEFCEKSKIAPDDDESVLKFRGEILRRYFRALWPVVDKYFGNRVLKGNNDYHNFPEPNMIQAYRDEGISVVLNGAYWTVSGKPKFDGGTNDWINLFPVAEEWMKEVKKGDVPRFSKIIYEYGAPSSLVGYSLGAFAAAFRRCGYQMAAFFTYTPSAVAEYNPGWLVHYLNLEHTPVKATAFAAAGEIFRKDITDESLKRKNESWSGPNFEISRTPDNVVYYDGRVLRYSNATRRKISNPNKLESISGRGNSEVVSCNGTGSYFMRKIDASHWKLSLFPNQKYVNDPSGEILFSSMANRYMDINKIPVVSRLMDTPQSFLFRIGKTIKCEPAPMSQDGNVLTLRPGEYVLTVQ